MQNIFYSSSFIIKLNQNVEAGSTEPLVVEKIVRYDEQGWIVLNVTKAVKDWQYNFRSNQGLHLGKFSKKTSIITVICHMQKVCIHFKPQNFVFSQQK